MPGDSRYKFRMFSASNYCDEHKQTSELYFITSVVKQIRSRNTKARMLVIMQESLFDLLFSRAFVCN